MIHDQETINCHKFYLGFLTGLFSQKPQTLPRMHCFLQYITVFDMLLSEI